MRAQVHGSLKPATKRRVGAQDFLSPDLQAFLGSLNLEDSRGFMGWSNLAICPDFFRSEMLSDFHQVSWMHQLNPSITSGSLGL